MSALSYKISFEHARQKFKNFNWHDILFLLNMGYLENEAAIEYAKEMVGHGFEHEETLIELLLLSPIEVRVGVLVKEYVAKLASDIKESDKKKSLDKIIFLVLDWLYDHREQFENPLGVVWSIIEDFDYPETIVDIFAYEDEGIYLRWEKYLRDEAQRWGVQ